MNRKTTQQVRRSYRFISFSNRCEEDLVDLPSDEETTPLNSTINENYDLIDDTWEHQPRKRGFRKGVRRQAGHFSKKVSLFQRIVYYIPFLTWIRAYNATTFRGDIIAGSIHIHVESFFLSVISLCFHRPIARKSQSSSWKYEFDRFETQELRWL